MRRPLDAKLTAASGLIIGLALTSFSDVAPAQSLFEQLYGRNSVEQADGSELYRQGEDAAAMASQTLSETQRVRSLVSTYGLEAGLAEDPTVKSGDIISTPKGLMVFLVSRNANGDRIGTLVPLSASPLRSERRLQALDKALRSQAKEDVRPIGGQ